MSPAFFVGLVALIVLLLSSACTNVQPAISIDNPRWAAHHSTINELEKWQFSGRFSAKTDIENWTGSIQWQQKAQQFKINLSGPLNSGSALLQGNDDLTELRTSDSTSFFDSDPQFLLQQHTGMILPVNNLRYWIVGMPAPEAKIDAIKISQNGQIDTLSQNNWEIRFKRYTDTPRAALPNKIFLNNDEVSVRLIIQEWQI